MTLKSIYIKGKEKKIYDSKKRKAEKKKIVDFRQRERQRKRIREKDDR